MNEINDVNSAAEELSFLDLSDQLPIYQFKDTIINSISNNQVIVVHGETGSGKTTQIPKYLFKSGINGDKMIGITQPRRIGAINMAKRVAEETNCALGKEIGYEIRFDNQFGASTKVKYMTDGILLNQCVADQNLKEYEIVMIDEAHERALRSDVLLGLLKSIVSRNENLRLIITSATMDTKKFSEYFFDAPIIEIKGKSFPVEIVYAPLFGVSYIDTSVKIVEEIHRNPTKGDILVFLTSQEEIENCVEKLKWIENLIVLPLYSALEYEEQQKVFENVSDNERKAIISTNIAETSLTIDGVRFIIDCGYVKQSNFNPRLGIDIWEDVRISKAQADQRKGRAGRTSNGWCYRLYRKEDYNGFLNQEKPEIQRKNLSEIYLKVVAFGLNPKSFDFIDPPNYDALLKSESELKELNFLDSYGQLTEDGKIMENFPTEPIIGKILLSSIKNKCVGNMVLALALLMERNVFLRSKARDRAANEKRYSFFDEDGDPFTLLKVYKEWLNNQKSEEWCRTNFIDYRSMEKISLVVDQLNLILRRQGHYSEPNSNIDKNAMKDSIFTGYYKNVCKKGNKNYVRCKDKEILYIHPSSSLFYSNPTYILYVEVRKTKKAYMHGVMQMDEIFWNKANKL